jgi:hypothetical protein
MNQWGETLKKIAIISQVGIVTTTAVPTIVQNAQEIEVCRTLSRSFQKQ